MFVRTSVEITAVSVAGSDCDDSGDMGEKGLGDVAHIFLFASWGSETS